MRQMPRFSHPDCTQEPSIVCRRLLASIAAIYLLCAAPARAQDEEDEERAPEVKADGMEYFRHKIHEAGFRPLSNWNEVFNNPQRTVIVLVGDKSVGKFLTDNRFAAELLWAVEQGAAVLIATDQSTAHTQLARTFSVQITGDKVDANPEDCFQGKSGRGKAFHPYVDPYRAFPLEEDSPKRMFHVLGRVGDEALATNRPSVLRITSDRIKTEALAGYPNSARTERGELTPRVDLFAAGGFYVRGRYLVLADHSIFLNLMMLAASNDTLLNSNLSFTIDCIDWLKGGEQGRNRCLFVEDGEIKTDFELKFPETKDSDLEKLLKLLMFLEANGNGNKIVAKAQDADLFNAFLTNYYPTREIIRTLLIVLVCLSVLFALWLTVRNRTTTDPARALVTPELAAMIPKGDVLRQRFDSLHEVENVYEAARQLIRDFLSGMGAEPDAHGLPPKLVVEDCYDDEANLRRKIARLWRIAYDTVPIKVAPEEWKAIKEDLQEVLAEADDGWWMFSKRMKDLERMKDEG